MKERASGSRRLPASAWVFDGGLALGAAGLATAQFVSMSAGGGLPRGRFALGFGLVLLHTLPLAGRRRFPGTMLALVVASGLAGAALFLPPFFLGPAILVAVYSVAAYGCRWVSLAGLAVAELGLAAVQRTPLKLEDLALVGFMGIFAVAWLLGHSPTTTVPMPPGWRSGRPSWSGPGRSWPAGRWSRNGCAWPGSCMTWSPTP
jgi:hypothetical protein